MQSKIYSKVSFAKKQQIKMHRDLVQDQPVGEEDKLERLLTFDYRGTVLPVLTVARNRRQEEEEVVAPRMSDRQGRVVVAPRKWYQNSRRKFFPDERRNGRDISRRYQEVTARRGGLEMRNHPSVANLVFPRSFYPRHQGMIRLGGWYSPPVLDKVIQVRLCHLVRLFHLG